MKWLFIFLSCLGGKKKIKKKKEKKKKNRRERRRRSLVINIVSIMLYIVRQLSQPKIERIRGNIYFEHGKKIKQLFIFLSSLGGKKKKKKKKKKKFGGKYINYVVYCKAGFTARN